MRLFGWLFWTTVTLMAVAGIGFIVYGVVRL